MPVEPVIRQVLPAQAIHRSCHRLEPGVGAPALEQEPGAIAPQERGRQLDDGIVAIARQTPDEQRGRVRRDAEQPHSSGVRITGSSVSAAVATWQP